MKAIQTSYRGCTNHRPARVKVWAAQLPPMWFTAENLPGGTLDEQSAAAARCYAAFYGWRGDLIAGTLPNGDIAHVFEVAE